MPEIALSAAHKVKLHILEADDNPRARKMLAFQQEPGHFFTVVQIALNAVSILGGIWG
nr:CNNM domain-containing protein [uncultured Undibacterium sp.]